MAVKLLTVNNVYNIREAQYIVDEENEKDSIPVEDKVQGTLVAVIKSGKKYRMNSSGQWIPTTSGEGGGGSGLPDVTAADNGKVLGVVSGEWNKMDAPDELPSVASGDNGKILGIVNGEWNKMDAPDGLPSVTASDSGKILQVNSSGEWAVELITNSLPDYSGANEGDVLSINNGEPAWNTLSGGDDLFLVRFSGSGENITADKTFAEIMTAIRNKAYIAAFAYDWCYSFGNIAYSDGDPYYLIFQRISIPYLASPATMDVRYIYLKNDNTVKTYQANYSLTAAT